MSDADTLRTCWKLDDLFVLDAKEKAAIKFQTCLADTQEVYLCDASTPLPDKEVELDANDLARTKRALTTAVHRAQDRGRLEPLVVQLDT